MEPNRVRANIALLFLFFLCIALLGIIIYQSKNSTSTITLDAYKEELRKRDSIIDANIEISNQKQKAYEKKADSLQFVINDNRKKDSVIFYNYEKNKPKYSGYSPAKRNAALDSLLRSRK